MVVINGCNLTIQKLASIARYFVETDRPLTPFIEKTKELIDKKIIRLI